MGPEHLLTEAIQRGGHGGVNGGALIDPRLLVELYEAATRADSARVSELQQRLLRLGKIYEVGRHTSSVIKGMKCALSLLGICDDFMAEPLSRFHEPEREQVRAILDSLGLPVSGSTSKHGVRPGRSSRPPGKSKRLRR
jgi:4-hydroxy-tetrahydrodipicolinate synthase